MIRILWCQLPYINSPLTILALIGQHNYPLYYITIFSQWGWLKEVTARILPDLVTSQLLDCLWPNCLDQSWVLSLGWTRQWISWFSNFAKGFVLPFLMWIRPYLTAVSLLDITQTQVQAFECILGQFGGLSRHETYMKVSDVCDYF